MEGASDLGLDTADAGSSSSFAPGSGAAAGGSPGQRRKSLLERAGYIDGDAPRPSPRSRSQRAAPASREHHGLEHSGRSLTPSRVRHATAAGASDSDGSAARRAGGMRRSPGGGLTSSSQVVINGRRATGWFYPSGPQAQGQGQQQQVQLGSSAQQGSARRIAVRFPDAPHPRLPGMAPTPSSARYGSRNAASSAGYDDVADEHAGSGDFDALGWRLRKERDQERALLAAHERELARLQRRHQQLLAEKAAAVAAVADASSSSAGAGELHHHGDATAAGAGAGQYLYFTDAAGNVHALPADPATAAMLSQGANGGFSARRVHAESRAVSPQRLAIVGAPQTVAAGNPALLQQMQARAAGAAPGHSLALVPAAQPAPAIVDVAGIHFPGPGSAASVAAQAAPVAYAAAPAAVQPVMAAPVPMVQYVTAAPAAALAAAPSALAVAQAQAAAAAAAEAAQAAAAAQQPVRYVVSAQGYGGAGAGGLTPASSYDRAALAARGGRAPGSITVMYANNGNGSAASAIVPATPSNAAGVAPAGGAMSWPHQVEAGAPRRLEVAPHAAATASAAAAAAAPGAAGLSAYGLSSPIAAPAPTPVAAAPAPVATAPTPAAAPAQAAAAAAPAPAAPAGLADQIRDEVTRALAAALAQALGTNAAAAAAASPQPAPVALLPAPSPTAASVASSRLAAEVSALDAALAAELSQANGYGNGNYGGPGYGYPGAGMGMSRGFGGGGGYAAAAAASPRALDAASYGRAGAGAVPSPTSGAGSMSRSRAAAIVQAVHGSPHAGPGASSARYNVGQQPPPPPAGMPPASAYGLGHSHSHGYGDDGYGPMGAAGAGGAVTDPVIAAALAKADFAVQQATVTAQRAAEGAAAAYSMMRR